MKKLLALLVCLAALLSGCSSGSPEATLSPTGESTEQTATAPTTEPTEVSISEPTTAATEEAVTDSATDPTEEGTTESATEDSSQEAPTQAGTPSFTVQTDFSVYSPESIAPTPIYIPSNSKDGNLLPLAEPTSVYPYYGIPQRTYYGGVEGRLYGLTDPQGRLLTEPVYSDIRPLKSYVTGEVMPFWLLEITTPSEVEEEENPFDGAEQSYGLASMDGTFFLDCEYPMIELCGDRILCFKVTPWADEPMFVEVYDAEGTLRFTSDKVPMKPEEHLISFSYGDGLYVVSVTETDYTEESYYYIDENGNQVFGPYLSAQAFSEGLAVVSVERDRYTYLKKDGTLFPHTYAYCDGFSGGVGQVMADNWVPSILNTAGETVIPYSYNISSSTDDRVFAVQSNAADPLTYCYSKTGDILWETSREYPRILTEDLFTYSNAANEVILERVSTGETLSFPMYSDIQYISTPTESYLVAFAQPTYDIRTVTHTILTPELQVVGTVESTYFGFPEKVTWGPDGTEGFAIRDGKQVTLYRSPHSPMGTYTMPDFQSATLFPDGTVSFIRKDCTEFYDKDGNLFFRYVFNLMDD